MKKVIAFSAIFIILCATLLAYSIFELQPKNKAVAEVSQTETPKTVNESILYVSDATGDNEIYMMDLKTKATANLTNNPADDMNPQLTKDGKLMAFYSDRDGDNEIYLMDMSSNMVTQLTRNKTDDYDPSFSPDGTQIVYKSLQSDKLGDIYIMNKDGTQKKNLTRDLDTTEEWDPTFSPDGEYIYFVQRQNSDHFTDEIFYMKKDGSDIEQLTNNDVPDWYPTVDTKGLLFASREDKNATDNIFTIPPNETERTNISNLRENDADPAWDKTGDRVIFINDQDGDYDMYILNLKEQSIQIVSNTKSIELSPIFVP